LPDLPVTIMTYGNADLEGVPWEIARCTRWFRTAGWWWSRTAATCSCSKGLGRST